MKKLSFGFLLFVVFISGCGSINQTDVIRERNLPDDFTINVYYDATSSGGDKIQKATITFKQGLVVSGRREYHGNVPLYKECVADSASLSWERYFVALAVKYSCRSFSLSTSFSTPAAWPISCVRTYSSASSSLRQYSLPISCTLASKSRFPRSRGCTN